MLKTLEHAESEPTIYEFYDSEKKLKTLLKVEQEVKKPVSEDLKSLKVWKRGNSINFYGNIKIKGNTITQPVGKWKREKNGKGLTLVRAISEWQVLRDWARENQRHPKYYGNYSPESNRTFEELIWEYWESSYKSKLKEEGDSQSTRINRLKKLIQLFGADTAIRDFEITNKGRKLVDNVLQSFWVKRECHASGQTNRRILNKFFNWCEESGEINPLQNPCLKPFDWEELASAKSKNYVSLAPTIEHPSWGKVPEFVASFSNSTNRLTGNEVYVDQVVKNAITLHLLAAIRTDCIVRFKWEWFNEKENYWRIPAPTIGLKRSGIKLINYGTDPKLKRYDHIIPSTPEIEIIINRMREINGEREYVFHSPFSQSGNHITSEAISKHFRETLGWAGEQTPHGWRSVITTGTREFGDHIKTEVMDRQMDHKQQKGSIKYYDQSKLLKPRREFMEWWSKTCVNELGLIL